MTKTTRHNPKFWNNIAEKYAKQPIADEAAYQRKLKVTRAHMHPQMRVLEFGCGTGTTAVKHAPYVEHITAVDISAQMLKIGDERAKKAGVDNIDFIEADFDSFTAADQSFDMILAMSILHLLEDMPGAIQKTHNMLKPGGFFISSTACLKEFPFYIRWAIPIMQLIGKAPFVNAFSTDELRREIEATGFEILELWAPGKTKSVFIVAQKC